MTLRIGDASVEHLMVVGFGVTGKAVCRYAARHGLSVTVSERRTLTTEERAWLAGHGIACEDAGHSDRALDGIDAVVLSPGVPVKAPLVDAARRRSIPVHSELDLAALASGRRPIVAVTGTNGKSSTVSLIGALLRDSGWDAPVVGNVGVPFIDVIEDADRRDAFVVEASSYQLEQSEVFCPDVGVLLNLEPDHLVRHKTMDAYRAAKGRLFRLQTPHDVAILPAALIDDFPEGRAQRVRYDDERLALPDGAGRLPPHQRANLRAALCACEALHPDVRWRDVPIDRIVSALRLPHRMEPIGSVYGVRAIDDSKATNPASTIAALAAVRGPVVLLLGGRMKEAGYDALRTAIDNPSVRRTILFGEAADRLANLLEGRPVHGVPDVDAAVRAGLAAARAGDALLFSPACSSFDAFSNFEVRGEAFARAVRAAPGFTAD